jgi:site-specific DNA recombinase
VRIVSITQSFGDDPASELAVGMLALFDEYHSAENSKHVKRTMLANASRGFWNGQTPAFGYCTVAVPRSRGKDRKKLEIDPVAASVVRFVFKTYVYGHNEAPIGITQLAALLNERGEQLRGKPFHVSNVHLILTNTAYLGVVMYNRRDSKAGEVRPEDEWVPIPIPRIIDDDLFYAARAQMAARDPRMGVAAVKTNTNLLTGHVTCGCDEDGCGGGMTTGTGKSGKYSYYVCHKRSHAGASQCGGRRIPMGTLNDLVVNAIVERVLAPDRLRKLLDAWLERGEAAMAGRRAELKGLRTRKTLLEGESANVIKLVRSGICSAEDPQIAAELGNISAQKKHVAIEIEHLERQLVDTGTAITPEILTRFGQLIADKLRDPNNPAIRQAYVRLLIGRVEVGKQRIRITGSRRNLAKLATDTPPHMVPKAEREWRTRQDSNLWPLPSEGSALSS